MEPHAFGIPPELTTLLGAPVQFSYTGTSVRRDQTFNQDDTPVRLRSVLRRLQFLGDEGETLDELFGPVAEAGVSQESIERNTVLKKYEKKKTKTDTDNNDADPCSICLCQFEEDQDVRYLRCNHVFHSECIDIWLSGRANCPMCRGEISSPS